MWRRIVHWATVLLLIVTFVGMMALADWTRNRCRQRVLELLRRPDPGDRVTQLDDLP